MNRRQVESSSGASPNSSQRNQPQLLDFQAYVSEDGRQLKLMFVFPEGEAGPRPASRPEPARRGLRDSGVAGVLAGAAIVVMFLAAAYLGSTGLPIPA